MKFNFNLQHFSFFCLGALTIMLTDVYVFSDFTAPVITATTASITLLIALKTAAKVNKWLDDKIKDKKFEQAHHFFEDLHRLTISIAYIGLTLDRIPLTSSNLKDVGIINDLALLKSKIDISNELLTELSIYDYYFKGLNIKLKDDAAHNKYFCYAAKVVLSAEACLESYRNTEEKEKFSIPKATFISRQQSFILYYKKEAKAYYDTFDYISKGLAQIEFSNMFDLKGG